MKSMRLFVPVFGLADTSQLNNFIKNLAIAGGCLALFVSGAGAYSVDEKTSRRFF